MTLKMQVSDVYKNDSKAQIWRRKGFNGKLPRSLNNT